jgi:hypothetical protein
MSVGAHIQFVSEDKESLYFPLATEMDFANHWVPAAEKQGLKWMPQFQTGVLVSFDDLDTVLEEFRFLRMDFEKRGAVGESLWENFVGRIDRVLALFSNLDRSEIGEIFIG